LAAFSKVKMKVCETIDRFSKLCWYYTE